MARLKALDRQELLQHAEEIHKGYGDRLNCAERVFLTLHRLMDADIPAEAVCLLSGLGGGVGGTRQDICGALTGGVAALGLVHGRQKPPEGSREQAYEVSRDFVCRFRNAYGATVCRELIGDLTCQATPEAEERRKARCAQYTLNVIRMCIDTLAKHDKLFPGG
jgi:C_GCAxxG_C_C family probable redox protein